MQCKSDLKSDEEIFAEKSRQQTDMQEMIDRLEREQAELAQQLEEAQEKIQQLNEQVLAKQLEIDASNARIQVIDDCHVLSDSLSRHASCTFCCQTGTQMTSS